MNKSETLVYRRKLEKLVKEWIRMDVMLLYGDRFDNLEFLKYLDRKVWASENIRYLVYGESDLGKIAMLLGIKPKNK